MTNLVEELGVSYVLDRFRECMFLDGEGKSCYIDGSRPWLRGHVAVNVVDGTPEAPVVAQGQLTAEFFKDLTVLATPALGWRQSNEGRYLVHFTRDNRSYHRAVAPANLKRSFAPSTRYLVNTSNLDRAIYDGVDSTALLVLKPQYTPFREGLEAMRNGAILSFAVSPTIAVIPDMNNSQAVLFNTTRVAVVRPDGELVFTFPSIQPLVEDQL